MQVFRLRPMRPAEVTLLCALETRAAQAFAAHGYPAIADAPQSTPAEFLVRFAGADLVVAADAADAPAGFLATLPLGGWLWVAELSVDPGHGRRGVGTALLDHAWNDARARACSGVALSTFRDVPFNAPFYARRGFVRAEPSAAAPPLAARWRAEIPPGVAPAARVLMLKPVVLPGT